MGTICNRNCIPQSDEVLKLEEIISIKINDRPENEADQEANLTDYSPLSVLPLPSFSDTESTGKKSFFEF